MIEDSRQAGAAPKPVSAAAVEAGLEAMVPWMNEVGDFIGLDIRPALAAALGAALLVVSREGGSAEATGRD